MDGIGERLTALRARIDCACLAAGGLAGTVEMVAISKFQSPKLIREAVLAGQHSFGENYAQEMAVKKAVLSDIVDISWHFTGHLQTNKAKSVVGQCILIQSVDSAAIAGKIAGIAKNIGIVQDVLIEVNIDDEAAKSGVEIAATDNLCQRVLHLDGIRLQGLMAMAPGSARWTPGAARSSFARLRKLFERLPAENRRILSMGMSGDFEDAIAEGATMVRIGSALFGPRKST
jgi:pyridoxal phosphate enzyme (YggS family)